MERVDISPYLESTYLKNPADIGISEEESFHFIINLVEDAISYNFRLVMILPEYIKVVRDMIASRESMVRIGTVIDFPLGNSDTDHKMSQANECLKLGADELDYVADYHAFKNGDIDKFTRDISSGVDLAKQTDTTIKWIIETGALSSSEIRNISKTISDIVISDFPDFISNVFIKTSTGFYKGRGAMVEDIQIIRSVSDLPIKASGGITTIVDCLNMIDAGVTRIGTSKAKEIFMQNND